MALTYKQWLDRLEAGRHGGIDDAELKALGIPPEDVSDFSVCTNPYMPPPGLTEALAGTAYARYPDSACGALREQLAAKLEISQEHILCGNGTTELIRLIGLAFLRRRDSVLIIGPTYGEYATTARIHGAGVTESQANEANNFKPDIDDIIETIKQRRPRAVFVCNPNNPTGHYLPKQDVEKILDAATNAPVILDEAYAVFVKDRWNALELLHQENIIILRSMTKDYNLPGLRLGYAAAPPETIAILRKVCPPWNVNAFAQRAGLAVLANNEYLEESLQKTAKATEFLAAGLKQLGFRVLSTAANYFLVGVGSAAEFRKSLLPYGLLVRDCTSFGLPEYVRLSPRTLPECEKLLEVIKNLLDDNGEEDAG